MFGASSFCIFREDTKISLAQIILGSDNSGKESFERNLVRRIRKRNNISPVRPFYGSRSRDAF